MSKKKQDEPRVRDLPPEAARHLMELQGLYENAKAAYLTAAQNVVRGMGLPDPKEGHKWVVVPQESRVREVPDGPPPK